MSSSEAQKYVNDAISKYPVVVFGRPGCPACRYTKSILSTSRQGVLEEGQVQNVNKDTLGKLQPHVTAYITQLTGQNYIPNVFVGGKSIAYKDVVSHYKTGQLRQMMAEAKKTLKTTST